MATHSANGETRLHLWRRVRAYAVPQSMITTASERRSLGDWAGACAAARVDVDLDLRAIGARHGPGLVARLRADLRNLAPDLLRWHLPRTAPEGLLRPGLTATLSRYPRADGRPPLHLVVRTPPAWAEGGQRFSLALWDPARPQAGVGEHPRPRPNPRFRLDLHRHLWDARRVGELRERSDLRDEERWAAEARRLLRAEGHEAGQVAVQVARARRRILDLHADGGCVLHESGPRRPLPLLPDAAAKPLPDLELLRAGLIGPEALHPLVAAALAPGQAVMTAVGAGDPARVRTVACRGEPHRLGLVDGALAPLNHGPDELRREALLGALGGPRLPCLVAVEQAGHRPEVLDAIRGRLDHGDMAGVRAVLAELLGPDAPERPGPLRDELRAAELRRIDHMVFRAGLFPGARRALPASRPARRTH